MSANMSSRLALTATLSFALTIASLARGDVTPEQKAAAQALFDDAKRLASEGKYADACPKFATSQKMDPSVSTQFKLADCEEHLGKTATAWALYLDVLAASRGQRDKEEFAQKRVDAIVPKLTRMTLDVKDKTPGLEVRRDGVVMDPAAWRTALPVDPGPHLFAASAPGKRSWSATISVSGEGKTVDVPIPVLDSAPAASATAPAMPPPSASSSSAISTPPPPATSSSPATAESKQTWTTTRTAGVVVGGVGVASLIVGAITGAIAISKNNEALQPENCVTKSLCTQHGLDLTSSAKTAAGISTATFLIGGVAVASGVVLFAVGGNKPAGGEARLSLALHPNGASLRGNF